MYKSIYIYMLYAIYIYIYAMYILALIISSLCVAKQYERSITEQRGTESKRREV